MNDHEYICLTDAAPLMGVKSGSVVLAYIRRGLLSATKIGPMWVTTQADINAYLSTKRGMGRPRGSKQTQPRTPPIGYIDPQKVILPR